MTGERREYVEQPDTLVLNLTFLGTVLLGWRAVRHLVARRRASASPDDHAAMLR